VDSQLIPSAATPLIPRLQWEEGLGEEAAPDADAAGNLLSLALSSHWRRGDELAEG
jgi:hypothetical protein